jgi:thioredoxin 1
MSTSTSISTSTTDPGSGKVIEINDHNFEAMTGQGSMPVLLDFTAVWCPPCRTIAPHLAALAREYEGRVRFGKVDVEENPALTARYDVRNMPTLLLLKDGQVVGQLVGAVPRTRIEALLTRA